MNTTPRKLIAVATAILMASTSAFAAVKNGASLKGNEYTKGGNNAKGGGIVAWNEYSSVDPTAFSHDLSSGDLTVLKDGDYLVAVTVPLSTIAAERNTHRADLLVNGTAVPTALGESSYMRVLGEHSEGSDHFAVLVALTANDVLTVKTTPTAANALSSFIGTCSLYAELVEGDRNVFSASATEIQSGTNLNVEPDTGDQGLVWTSARKGSAYTHSDGNAEITFKDDGNYMVYVNVPLRGNIARGSVGLTLNLDDDYIEGARGQQGYIRNGNNHKDASIHFSGMIRADAGQVLTVITEQLALAGTVTVQANRAASIFIEKVRNDGLFSDSFTGTTAGENLNPNNKTALAFVGDGMSLDIIDNLAYANEGDNEENIVIKKAGSYLLSFNSTFEGGNARANPRVTVEVNGSVVPGATSTAHYLRHLNGHDESTGSFVALLSDLAVDDVVTVSVQREGNGGTVTAPEGGKVALQAKAAYTAAAGDTSPPKLASFVGLGLDGFQANLEDFGLSVDAASIKAIVDGAEAAVTTSKDGSTTTIIYAFASMPAPYSSHSVALSYSDSTGTSYTKDFSFTVDVDYKTLPASIASTSVDKSTRGFIANVTQISTIQTESVNNVHGNSTANAEKQFRGEYINPNEFDDDDNPLPYLNEADPDAWDGWSISPVELDGAINWNQDEGAAIGNFGEDQSIPQIPGWGDSADGIVAEILGYLELSKGLHTLGVNSDDGFKLSFGPNPKDQLGIIAGEFEGGRGAADTIFNIVAEADGLYPVRLLWYEGGGGANVEFFSVDDKGKKILINDPDNADAIKAYRTADSAPYISRVTPTGGGLAKTIEFDFVNGDLSVDKSSVKLKLNGEDASVTTKSTDNGISVVYDHGDYLPGGAHTVELSYTESGGTARVRNYSFSIPKGRIDILMDKPTVTVNFDDLTGTAGVGAIGNPDLTYVGGPELGVPALYPNGVGTAVRFDGSKDQRLRVADHPDINITNGPWEEMSWEFWFKPEKLPVAGETITLYEQGGNTRGIHIYLSGTQESDPTEAEVYMLAWNRAETIWGGTLNQVGAEGITGVNSNVKLGSVYHVAFVMDGDPSGDLEGTLTGYLNGRQVGQVSGVHLLYNHSDDIAFAYAAAQAVDHITGNRGEQPGLGFTGVLDDAAFYNIALSAEQVQAHFQGGYGGGGPQAIEITSQPQDATAQEADTATFSVEFTGSPLVDVKWLVNGEEAATDAAISGSSINIVATEANNGAKVKAELTNSVGTVTTAEVTLTSVVDTTAPGVASANAVAGTVNEVTIAFNEVVSAATAESAANYTIDDTGKSQSNLSTKPGVVVSASSNYDAYPASRAIDGNLATSWFAADNDAANLGTTPYVEVVLPRLATVNQINIRGNREWAKYDIFAGRIDLSGDDGTILFTADVEKTGEFYDVDFVLPTPQANVRTVRFTSTDDESIEPGLAELEIVGTLGGLTVNSATLGADGKTVTLSTSQQTPGNYTVTITGVKDVSVRENTGDLSTSVESAIDYAAEVISDGPVIYWKLAETEGTVANDEMGNRTGTYVSASGNEPPTLGADSLVASSQDGAVHFNAANGQLMRVGDHAVMNVGGPYTNKSIELWFNADSLPRATPDADFSPKMIVWEQGGGWKAMIIYLNGTQDSDSPTKADLYFKVTSHIGGNPDALWGGTTDERAPTVHAGHADTTPVFAKTEVEVGKTYYVVAVMEGDPDGGLEGKLKLYVNGSLAAETGGVGQLYNHGNDAGMGGINSGSIFHDQLNDAALLDDLYHFNGTIDEFAEYNAVLTDDQIAGRYEVGNTSAAVPALATDKAGYMSGEDITVNFSNGLGNPADWVGLYRPDMTPGDVGSLRWAYVSGTTTAGEGLTDGAITFAGGLPAGSYVARFFENDGYTQIADAVAFTVVNPPGVTTSKAKYTPGESITVNFSDGPGNPADWVGLYRPDMTPGDVGSLVWAYVGGTTTAGEGLTDGSVTFANGMAAGDFKAIYFENDGYGQLASTTFSVAAAELPEGVLFAEDFDGLALGPWVSDSESGGDGTDWTATAPTGWVTATGDAHGATAGGDTVTEFDGWTFVDPVTWNATAGQDRSQFTKGSGAIAVADSDEFDDKADAKFNASLATPAIDISSSAAGSLVLTYDSSWRQEPQNGKVTVAFDGGDAITLLELTPDTPTAYNETVSLNLDNPAGAQTAVITWEKQGHNNWWWAIDNIYVDASAEPGLLFGDSFDSDSSGNWAVHKSTDDTAVTFGYDYSADGIPAAPNSDGTTIGIKFEVNIAAPTVAEAVSISPAGGNFTGDYQVNFDMWINANGPFPGGGGGSTEFFTAGVGTTGDHLQWAADTADGAWFGVTGEGGSGNSGDFRAHIGGTRQAAESGAYAAGTTADSRNNNNAHYADAFPGQSPPAAQAAAFPDKQTGAVANGAVGFAWRQVTITKIGDSVTWAIDGVAIATLEQSLGAFTTEGNIFVGYYDAFSSVSDNAATSFGLVDNIRVVEIQTTLPPTLSIVNNGDGSVTVTFEGTLQAANSVNGPWADVEGATSPLTIPSDQAAQFGRAVK